MASIVRRFRTRVVTRPDGTRARERTGEVMFYARLKTSAGAWRMVKTGQPTRAAARRWAEVRCGCFECGGPEHARRAEIAAQPVVEAPRCGALMDKWIATLTNRSAADDRCRFRKHVRATFAQLRPDEVTLPIVMQWIDRQRTTISPRTAKQRGARCLSPDGRLSDSTIRKNLDIVSRFFSWCIERGHAQVNPVRQIPMGKRPQQAPKDHTKPWLDDDKRVRDILRTLPSPFREMFYLGNRSGLRPGEQRALRMSDFGFTADGAIRVRYSDDGPLKEDKRKEGKVKWAPAPDDFDAVIGPWLAKRQAEGAQPEEVVFLPDMARCSVKQSMARAWRAARAALGLKLSYYEATRHSFVSRHLEAGASLDEVSAAIGHASVQMTERHYAHFIRKTFSPALRTGIGATYSPATAAPVLPIRPAAHRPKRAQEHAHATIRHGTGRS